MAWIADFEPPATSSSTLEQLMGVPNQQSLWSGYTSVDTTKYQDLYERWEPDHWNTMQNDPSPWDQTYYDRGFGYYAADWRVGNATYISRGDFCVTEYRDNYVLPNNGGVAPRWCFPEGLAYHYLTTGDTSSLNALELMADSMKHRIDDILTTGFRDGRIQGRAILNQVIAYLVTGDSKYSTRSTDGVNKMLQWFDAAGASGAWDSCSLDGVTCGQTNGSYCGGMASFTITHAIIDCLVRHHELVAPISRLPEVLEKTMDRTYNPMWVGGNADPKDNGHRYIQPYQSWLDTNTLDVDTYQCDNGNAQPSKDLMLLEATAYGHAFKYTGLPRFKTRGDEVFAMGLTGSLDFPTIFLSGGKQFNQSFYRSWRYPELVEG